MIKYYRYRMATGEILGHGADSSEPILQPGEAYVEAVNPSADVCNTCYVSGGALIEKSRLAVNVIGRDILADGVDVAIIDAGLPIEFRYGRERYQLDDGYLEFRTIDPGVHRLEFRAVNFLPEVVEVTAS